MIRAHVYRALYVTLSLTFVLAGCQSKPMTQKGRSGLAEIKVQRIALLPFFKCRYDTSLGAPISRLLYGTIDNLCSNTTEVTGNADEVVTGFLQKALQKRYKAAFITAEEVRSAYSGLPKNSSAATPQSRAIALGRELQADHVMVGIVWRYKERVGTAQASASPASVAFSLYLVNVAQGIPVWEAAFDKTQQALTDNLLNVREFFSMGARWLTADELACYGIDQILD